MTNNKIQKTTQRYPSIFRELNERELLLNTTFHQKIEIDSFYTSDLLSFLTRDCTIDNSMERVIFDTFCPKCKKESTFKDFFTMTQKSSTNLKPQLDRYGIRSEVDYKSDNLPEHVYIKEYVCSRDSSHVYSFYFLFDGEYLTKVGQTLSHTAAFALESKKYKKYFPEIQKELFISMKLFSDGIGGAAILYLRRIFEKLINTASDEHLVNHPADKIKLKEARMVGKIEILKDSLPGYLVKNKNMYSILSTAVHELEEDLCLIAYPFIKDSILMILDQEIDRILDKKKEEKLTKEMDNFNAFLGRQKKS